MRVNAGKIKVDRRLINLAPSGTSDIIGMLEGGRMFAFEVKTSKRRNTVTDFQQEFIDTINENGGIAAVVCDFDEVNDILNNI